MQTLAAIGGDRQETFGTLRNCSCQLSRVRNKSRQEVEGGLYIDTHVLVDWIITTISVLKPTLARLRRYQAVLRSVSKRVFEGEPIQLEVGREEETQALPQQTPDLGHDSLQHTDTTDAIYIVASTPGTMLFQQCIALLQTVDALCHVVSVDGHGSNYPCAPCCHCLQ